MPSGEYEKRQLEKMVNAARPIAVLLSLLVLEKEAPGSAGYAAAIYLVAYLALAILVLLSKKIPRFANIPFPAEIDAIVLAFLLPMTPSLASFWAFFLFAAFGLANQNRHRRSTPSIPPRSGSLLTNDATWLSAGAAIALFVRLAWNQPYNFRNLVEWSGFAFGTIVAGLWVGWLGMHERELIHEDRFLEHLVSLLRVEKGLAESVRLALSELAREFDCERAYLAVCDEEVDRLFTWKADQDRRHVLAPDALTLSHAGAYLAEDLSQNICWNSIEGAGKGFGWNRISGESSGRLESLPETTRKELQARRLMAVTILTAGHPSGRVLLVNRRKKFTRRDLHWLERIVRQWNAPLENLFLLRSFRARAVESERSRISRDLHDGILQTLLSLNIQFGVLRRKLPNSPEQVSADLVTLEKTMREEGEELRQMVKDLRPLRVESADLREMMYSFAERFQNESGMAVDLFLDENHLRAPDRICREVFQIYRESLNNIKKHAQATHVVVKLWQDDTKVFLVVDDNGEGFSFSGRYTSEELDRLRLGPISIKERTRSVGGVLTVESSPGHGVRLTIEIPLN
jgi:signal transduction histidine kinase